MKKYTVKQKIAINLKAKLKAGLVKKQSAADKFIFMQQCIDQLTSSGDATDETDAEQICSLLWEEGSDLGDFGD